MAEIFVVLTPEKRKRWPSGIERTEVRGPGYGTEVVFCKFTSSQVDMPVIRSEQGAGMINCNILQENCRRDAR
ncbi:hypothetical protein Peur_010211 [Populus x canadensis]